MTDIGITGLVLVISNFLVSYKGFKDVHFFERYKFEIDSILIRKDYLRLISSGFLHVSWSHLIFNLISLYAFSNLLELQLGIKNFLLVYFTSMLGGNLLALFVHRNHGDYSSVGASGAISGVIFASIALFPGLEIGFLIIPFYIPSWIYGILYIAYTIYGIRSDKDNIGHENHLGGALTGMLLAIILQPTALLENYLIILVIVVPTVVFIFLIITKPHLLLIDNLFYKTHTKHYNIDHRYNEEKLNKQVELDKILDKISQKGIDSLSKKEREKLEEYSK